MDKANKKDIEGKLLSRMRVFLLEAIFNHEADAAPMNRQNYLEAIKLVKAIERIEKKRSNQKIKNNGR